MPLGQEIQQNQQQQQQQFPLGAAIGAVGNIITTQMNNKAAKEREQQARAQNYMYNEKAAAAADERTRALYHDLYSPEAQMQQLKAAGLSPSIFASGGMAGKSGQSGAQGGGASGISPQVFAADPIGAAVAAAGIEKTKAETKQIEQQTQNLGTEQDLTIAKIAETYQNTANSALYSDIMRIDKQMKESLLSVQNATEIWQIEQAMHEASVMYYQSIKVEHEGTQIDLQNKFSLETWKTNVDKLTAELQNTIADTSLKWAGVQLSQEQTRSLIEHVAIDWYNANTNRENAQTAIKNLEAQMEQWCVQNGISKQQLDIERTKMWLDFASRNLGAILNIATKIR